MLSENKQGSPATDQKHDGNFFFHSLTESLSFAVCCLGIFIFTWTGMENQKYQVRTVLTNNHVDYKSKMQHDDASEISSYRIIRVALNY